MTAELTPAILRPILEELVRKRPEEPLIGVTLDGAWAGEDHIKLAGQERPVRVCRAHIDVHAACVEQEDLGGPLIVLTPLSSRELGLDVTARFAGQTLVRPSLARAVMQLFDAHDLDRRIAREGWLLRALLEHQPLLGYVPVPAGTLTADRAWEELLRGALDLPGSEPTLRELLLWSQSIDHLALLQSAGAQLRAGVRARVSAVPGAPLLLAIAEHARRTDEVLAVIGVLSVLVGAPAESATLLAAGRIAERYLGGDLLDLAGAAPALVIAAEQLVREPSRDISSTTWQSRARELCQDLGIAQLVVASDLLDDAWNQRLMRVSEAVMASLAGTSSPDSQLDAAEETVRRHVYGDHRHSVLDSVTAMVRLLRWLHLPVAIPPATLSAAVRDEVCDGGWVVWARAAISASGAPELSEGARALAEAVDARRSASAIAFAVAAARWDGDPADGLLGVEHVLDQIVTPVAKAAPTLVVVLDGMSVAVLRELLVDLGRERWIERRPAAMLGRPAALAVLPSLTTLSRSSLLTGTRVSGGQSDEAAGFAVHAGLRQAGTSGGPPLLLHKRALSDDGTTLSSAVRDEIFGVRRVLGVVINAIDDELSGAVQRRGRWTLRDIPVLDTLLSAARDAGRAVILLSDHGHVPERSQTQRVASGAGGGDRHRPAGGDAPGGGEVFAEGPRVLAPGGRVILAADPNIRYTGASKPGYHGGASPEELVAPIAILTAFETALDGVVDQEPDEPAWWQDRPLPAGVISSVPKVDRAARRAAPQDAQQTMFDDLEPSESTTAPEPEWLNALMADAEFNRQRERAGRGAPAEERVRALLGALGRHDGRLAPGALAAAAEVPIGRLDGLLAALRPLLNVDGYPILTVDRDADLVELRIADLRRQFAV